VERILYDRMAENDTRHWWYRARRDVLASLIARRIKLPADARILEVGCGTGHNLEMLARFGTIDAIEIDARSREIASARLGRPVRDARLPELTGLPDAQFDLVAMLDVLEHIEDDTAALRGLAARLRPGGTILVTVPQYRWLWSGHDVANHHFRRYTKASLRAVVAAAGLKLNMLQSFNSLLFPLAAADRIVARLQGREGSDDALPSPPVNAVLETAFGLERYLVGRIPMPPGVSLVAILST
jgi:2-polyprenyl-3-methyl-5-hydroxy-6-metoxy-1,4-benzoquinol methylase